MKDLGDADYQFWLYFKLHLYWILTSAFLFGFFSYIFTASTLNILFFSVVWGGAIVCFLMRNQK